MTQEVKPVTRAAQEVRKLLQEQGRVANSEVRQWLTEQDPELTPGDINFAIGYGENAKGGRAWWHEDAEGFLVDGPKPGATTSKSGEDGSDQVSPTLSDEVKKIALLDPSTVSEPRDQFYTIALNMGIAEKAARTTAYNCWGVSEMFDPAEAWQAIVQGSDLIPSQKKRLWRNWCSWAGIKISEDLSEKVERQYGVLSATSGGAGRGVASASIRRFIPIKGEVVMVEPDDPGGMPFSEALRTAERYSEQKVQATPPVAAAAPAESPAMAAMVSVLGNLATAALTPRSDPGAANSTTEIVKLMIESARSESSGALALMKQDLDHRLQNEARDRQAAEERSNAILLKLTDIIERQGQQPKNPFDSLDNVLPGIGQRLLDQLLNPPRQESAFRVTIGDQEGNMSLDDYERFMKVEKDKEFTKMLRGQIPEFFAMGRDFAQAARRAPGADRGEQPIDRQPAPQNDRMPNFFCVKCLQGLMLPQDVEQFTCPQCGLLQTLDGEILNPPVQQEELRPPALSTAEELADDVFDSDALVIRPSEKDREWSPEPAREEGPSSAGSEAAPPAVEAVASA